MAKLNVGQGENILVIIKLAEQIIKGHSERKLLEERGKIFLKALKEHEQTVRISIKNQTKQVHEIVKAIKITADNIVDPTAKLEAIRYLAEYGSNSIKELGKTAETALKSIPVPPLRKELQE